MYSLTYEVEDTIHLILHAMKTLIVLLITLFSVPAVSLAGTSGATASVESMNSRMETTTPNHQSRISGWKQRRMERRQSHKPFRAFLSNIIPGRNPQLGKTLSVLSLVLGVVGIGIMVLSLPLMTGFFFFLFGALVTITASWLAIISLIYLDKKKEKGYWRLGYITMVITLIPVGFIFLLLFFAALVTHSFMSPVNFFR